jgi:hypothetical protein
MRNLVEFSCAILLGIFLGSIMVQVGPGLPVSIAASFVLILVFYHWLHDIEGEAELVGKIFLVSAIGRVLLAIFLHNVIRDPATLAGDDSGYEFFGKTLAQAWSEDNEVLKAQLSRYMEGRELQNAYVYWNAILFYIFGNQVTLLPKCINAIVGSLTPIYFYRIAWRMSDPATARYSLYISVVAPSMILWSVLNLRDSFAILAITASIYYTICLKDNVQLSNIIKLGISMVAVTALRTYMFVILGLALSLSFVGFRKGRELRDLLVGFLVAVVLLYLFRGLGVGENDALKNASFEQLHQMRNGLASGSSAYAVGADVSSPLKALIFLPIGIVFFLFTPFPWEISSFRQLLAFPEVLLFYWLFPSMLKGLRRALKGDFIRWLPVLLPLFLVTVTYSIVEGNVGTAFRHKAQILGLYFILAAYEIAARQRERRGELAA